MSRVLQGALAFLLFLGIGCVTRYYYRQWVENVIKEAAENSARESQKLETVKSKFNEVKIDQPINMLPKVELKRPPLNRIKGSP